MKHYGQALVWFEFNRDRCPFFVRGGFNSFQLAAPGVVGIYCARHGYKEATQIGRASRNSTGYFASWSVPAARAKSAEMYSAIGTKLRTQRYPWWKDGAQPGFISHYKWAEWCHILLPIMVEGAFSDLLFHGCSWCIDSIGYKIMRTACEGTMCWPRITLTALKPANHAGSPNYL